MSRKPTKAALRRKARKLWGELIHKRDKDLGCYVGVGCAGRLHAHHLITRTNAATEFDPKNGILLCAKHHLFDTYVGAHSQPMAFAAFLHEKYGDEWDYVLENRNRFQTRTELFYVEQIEKLKALLEAT